MKEIEKFYNEIKNINYGWYDKKGNLHKKLKGENFSKLYRMQKTKDIRKNKQLFIVENTYTNKDVNINEIFEKGNTSKKTKDSKNHGLGLWEVRQTVKKNKNLDLYTTKSDKYFKQQFEIYC